jgi:uncharacterized protein YaiL (DUF2058 family)
MPLTWTRTENSAMQNLRDKLLKAGMVDKKAKKKADQRNREKRTRDKRAGVDPNAAQAAKNRTATKALEAKQEADRERARELRRRRQAAADALAAERRDRQRAEGEEQRKLQTIYRSRELIQAGMFMPEQGPVRFHFVSRSGGIRHLQLPTSIAQELDRGQLAIAELPGFERWGLVARHVAEQAMAIEPALIRFFTADADGELAAAPATVSPQAAESKLQPSQGLGPKGPNPDRRREG